MARKHNLYEVLNSLNRKKGCKVIGNSVEVLRRNEDIGNGTWGKLDYLNKVHKYRIETVEFFSK